LSLDLRGGWLSTVSHARRFRYFKTSPEVVRLAIIMYARYLLSRRNVDELLHERGIDITHATVRFWRTGLGVVFAAIATRRCTHSVIGVGTSTRCS
jgi:putative transposase